jgi:hypothetical protein
MCPIVVEAAGCVAIGSYVGGSAAEGWIVELYYNCPRAETVHTIVLEASNGLVCIHMDLQDR